MTILRRNPLSPHCLPLDTDRELIHVDCASHTYPEFHLLMPLYVCRRWEGIVAAREAQKLKWVRPNNLRDYPMPPADEPLIPHLTTLL